MANMRRFTSILARAVCLILIACAALVRGSSPHARAPSYDIGFANRTRERLNPVRAEWTVDGVKYTPSVGVLSPGSKARWDDAADPIPQQATVIWTTPDGKEHRQTVTVAKKIPGIALWSGTVWFKIKPDGVEVIPLTPKEERSLAEAGKEFP